MAHKLVSSNRPNKKNQISLASLLQDHESGALETQISLEVLSDFSQQMLEGQFVNQQFSGPLITMNLSQSHGTGPVTMGFLTVGCALLRAALITICLGPVDPVDLRAV